MGSVECVLHFEMEMQDASSDVNNKAKIDDDRNDKGITPLVSQMSAAIPSLCSNDNLTI